MNVKVTVDRPVTIEACGKKLKLTESEARQLVDKLCDALNYHPSRWYHNPHYYYMPCGTTDWSTGNSTFTTNTTDGIKVSLDT